jgi:hypothetical protein
LVLGVVFEGMWALVDGCLTRNHTPTHTYNIHIHTQTYIGHPLQEAGQDGGDDGGGRLAGARGRRHEQQRGGAGRGRRGGWDGVLGGGVEAWMECGCGSDRFELLLQQGE